MTNEVINYPVSESDILIFSSHKTATQSVWASLREKFKVSFGHSLKHLNMEPGALKNAIDLHYEKHQKPLIIFTVFREPISRLISSFFQTYGDDHLRFHLIKDQSESLLSQHNISELQSIFLKKLKNQALLGYHESLDILCEELDIKVDDLIFNSETKIGKYQTKNFILYYTTFDAIINNFLFISQQITGERFTLADKNLSGQKWYYKIQRDLTNTLTIPMSIINKIYHDKSPLLKIFYPQYESNLLPNIIKKYSIDHMLNTKQKLSIIVPVFNEEENITILHQRILNVCKSFNCLFEIIFVNDGSTDNSFEVMLKLSPLKIVNFRKNFGQTAALDAGIKASTGDILVTLDADLQNYPEDIPILIRKLNEGYDVVSGWRKDRQDNNSKKLISRGANFLRKYLVNDGVHDSGCTLKAFNRECFENLDLFGEMHRFIPALLRWRGFKVGEVVVRHDPRIHGQTKYNWKRIIKGFLDMLGIWFWHKYSNRPLHMFGTLGLLSFVSGGLILALVTTLKIFHLYSLTGSIWPLISVFLILMGVQLFVTGLLADIAIKTYYKDKGHTPYHIKNVSEQ